MGLQGNIKTEHGGRCRVGIKSSWGGRPYCKVASRKIRRRGDSMVFIMSDLHIGGFNAALVEAVKADDYAYGASLAAESLLSRLMGK